MEMGEVWMVAETSPFNIWILIHGIRYKDRGWGWEQAF